MVALNHITTKQCQLSSIPSQGTKDEGSAPSKNGAVELTSTSKLASAFELQNAIEQSNLTHCKTVKVKSHYKHLSQQELAQNDEKGDDQQVQQSISAVLYPERPEINVDSQQEILMLDLAS